ncbi:MAG: Phosphoribosylamine-glycine ligase [Candidatus Moranbacteria bacterium GW2011_GWF2_36_839]|nr:MAG: Phosphoribosylamine-glycine ligase [Candidatus Moranbacteria bacterium GW2011_GWF1_36_78]KKQ17466.1 MAG: Phosphoribosylamine-glycine ligase [Candidatus Moranbacteria bacterium GW2011_GWF2_36_839]HAT73933.1 phosphoribosylamine--glycine ligase [Candidatus Moranbacteria bacterium]HBY10541.1 phosphoribosylamine--glycine ligase [Candidatus Moranbacteria bacterium]
MAQFEGSKVFAKELMERYDIPTAPFIIFDSTDEIRKNMNFHEFEDNYFPIVLKVDGLAAGKGVRVCKNRQEVEDFLGVIDSGKFEEAASRIVMENCIFGEEASCIYITDKNGSVLPMATAQDHKAVFDKDEGPNTGGMGAYSPAPIISTEVEKKITERIINPLIEALRAESMLSAGVIYVGLMIDKKGDPYVLEFNARFGDPEIQPIVMRLETDLMEIIESAINGTLDQQKIKWDPRPAVCVVMASKGYPDKYAKGFPIAITYGTENINTVVFHAGTKFDDSGELITDGGRVLGVTALGIDTLNAKNNAYRAVGRIRCTNLFNRTDIANRAIDPSLL